MRIVSAVTAGASVAPALVPSYLGTHGGGERAGIATRPVAGSQWSCHVYFASVPAFCAAWYWIGTSLAGVAAPPGVTAVFFLPLLFTARAMATIAITTMIAMNG